MKVFFMWTVVFLILLCGCSRHDALVEEKDHTTIDTKDSTIESEDSIESIEETTDEMEERSMVFRDVYGVEYETMINPRVAKNPYKNDFFIHDGYRLSYGDEEYQTMLGVDVSHHQGAIDWNLVKQDGYDFAIMRIGYRGYGTTGEVCPDRMFEQNYTQARAAGLKVGVYFFAQAINEQEAREEADFVIDRLAGRVLDLPVVYDPESILDDEARTDNVSGEQFTLNTKAFCESIKQAGYEPMIYANMLWEAFELDLEYLAEYPIWYADYESVPQTPYDFKCWQYTNEAIVDGIAGVTDLDILIENKSE